MDRLAVVVLNYRTAEMARDCIETVEKVLEEAAIPFRIFVVDNDSGDGSHELLCERFDGHSRVEVRQAGRNGGYATGNNLVLGPILESREYDYVWLLNPDTLVLSAPSQTFQTLLERPRTAAVGSRLQDPDATPQTSAFRFPGFMSEFLQAANLSALNRLFGRWRVVQRVPERPARTDWMAGASVFFKVSALQEVGLFDEKFFLYYEEVDLFRRLDAAGWESWYDPEMRVVHHVGASTGISDHRRRVGEMPDYWYASRSYYFLKHHRMLGALFIDLSWLVGRLTFLLSRFLLCRADTASVKSGRIFGHNPLTRLWRASR